MGYTKKVQDYLDEARAILGEPGTSSPLQTPEDPASPLTPAEGQKNTLGSSLVAAMATRPQGQSLFKTVTQGAIQSVLSGAEEVASAPAVSQEKGVKLNPAGAEGLGNSTVANAAQRQLGTPYSWGGGTPSGPSEGFGRGAGTVGFDCSSLVQYAWGKAGVKLPRTTYDQINVGQAIDAKDMSQWQIGDLLFPSKGHVQMYIGNGKIIEAPSTGGHVQIVGPRKNGYIAVRRPA